MTAVGGCSKDFIWWGNYVVQWAAPTAWQTIQHRWRRHREPWVGFPCYVQLAHKIPRILELGGRSLKEICLLAVPYVPIMLKCRQEQIPSASRSSGKQPSQQAFGKKTFKTWPRLTLAALWKLVWKSLLDMHVSALNVSAVTKTFFLLHKGVFCFCCHLCHNQSFNSSHEPPTPNQSVLSCTQLLLRLPHPEASSQTE